MEITISIVNGTLRIYCHKHNLCMDSIIKIFSWEINTILLMNLGHLCSRTMTGSSIVVMCNVASENNSRLSLCLAKRVRQVASDTLC